ncbi:hypothetical protein HN682_00465 [Candidatus Peregrinibacteria bacterium]|jgi:hypothetical protein|nr:hypothetical protein [Candidatus Peregrinibacteria bacterium]
MGRHFDTLVELLNKGKLNPKEDSEVHSYLCAAVDEAALFEFPILSEEIRPTSNQDLVTYSNYLREYVTLSQERDHLLLAPYPVTAIEDPDSVVIFESEGRDSCIITILEDSRGNTDSKPEEVRLQIGTVNFKEIDDEAHFKMKVEPIYDVVWKDERKYIQPLNTMGVVRATADRLGTCAMAAMQQIIYISDPGNFILKRESNASRKQGQKRKGCKKQRKTVIRPHYTLHSREDLVRILKGESTSIERAPHPVRGHWRHFANPKYTLKVTHVSQHWRGEGITEGNNGMNYEVLLKTDFGELTPASEYKAKA